MTGTKMRQAGPAQATTTASCASVRHDIATVGHVASRNRESTVVRAPPSAPIGRPVNAETARSSAAISWKPADGAPAAIINRASIMRGS
ncbi:hypothetical protein, partial [Sphingomonas sp. Ant20]|uniref:hypothetical protein n=1 Tax=Sphingomonas sp. Ant20 TaxID=104605 RepID=UPI0027422881